MSPAVYVQTNDAAGNEVIAFSRTQDGALAPMSRYSTGGRGTGSPHLASAGSVMWVPKTHATWAYAPRRP